MLHPSSSSRKLPKHAKLCGNEDKPNGTLSEADNNESGADTPDANAAALKHMELCKDKLGPSLASSDADIGRPRWPEDRANGGGPMVLKSNNEAAESDQLELCGTIEKPAVATSSAGGLKPERADPHADTAGSTL